MIEPCENADPSKIAEHRDLLSHLRSAGFGELLDAMADPECCTRSGRPVQKLVARRLNLSRWQVSTLFRRARASVQ